MACEVGPLTYLEARKEAKATTKNVKVKAAETDIEMMKPIELSANGVVKMSHLHVCKLYVPGVLKFCRMYEDLR